MRARAGVFGLVVIALSGRAYAQVNAARAAFPATARGEHAVDRVVVSIRLEGDERPPLFVLASELRLGVRLSLIGRNVADALHVEPTSDDLRLVRAQLIGERLLEREATRAGDPRPSTDVVETAQVETAAMVARAGGVPVLLATLGLTRADYDAFVTRHLVVEEFLLRHLSRTVEPTEAQIRTAYQSERFQPYRAEGAALPLVRAAIRAELIREEYPRAIEVYVRSLGSRARITDWTSPDDGP